MKRKLRELAPALAALLFIACGSEPDTPDGGFSRAVQYLPDTRDVREAVWISDVAMQREIFGVELPGPDASDEDVIDYLIELGIDRGVSQDTNVPRGNRTGSQISGYGDFGSQVEDWRTSFGFTAVNVDLSIVSGVPPATYNVLQGRFGLTDVDRAIRSDETWKDQLEEESRKGVSYYSWADDYQQNLYARSGARPLGRGGRMRVTEDVVFWTYATGDMHNLIDVSTNRDLALASNEDFELLATIMDREGVYAGLLSDATESVEDKLAGVAGGYGMSPEQYVITERDYTPLALDPYDAYGAGASYDGSHYHIVIPLVYGEGEDAESNVLAAEKIFKEGESTLDCRAWSTLFHSPEVRTEGRVLIATARVGNPSMWALMYNAQDFIFYHK